MSDTYDWIVVGSGAAGLASALRAHDAGLSVLVLEATDQWGGSTAISGGVVWIPDNAGMKTRGIPDSQDDALAYLTAITGGSSSPERLETFVRQAPRVLDWFHTRTHLRLVPLVEYCDYFPELPGGKPGGRSMESVPFDGSRLGAHFGTLRKSHPQSQIMGRFGITAAEAKGFLVPSLKGRLALVRRFLQYFLRWFKRRRLPRDPRLHAGNALIASLGLSLHERGVPLWLSSPVERLVVEDGVVRGVVCAHEGRTLTLRARHGVMLAAGGFERNQAMREAHAGHIGPVDTAWNAGNQRNQGDAITWGMELGAATDLMDQSWWTPVTLLPKSDKAWVLVVEKSLPGSLFVNKHGKRFVNEAGPYLDVGRAMYDGDAVPDAFMLFDATFRRSYPVGPIAPGFAMPDSSLSRRLREEFLLRAPTLRELATRIGLDPEAVEQTVARFNAQAEAGLDEDFGRGNSLSDRYYADPRAGVNPCLRPLTDAPFYAIRIYPGDLGTKGGLVTDTEGRVLDPQGVPLRGLFAAGNTSASVMGTTYPGAGGTIGPALVFGALAADAAVADGPVAAAAAEGAA